MAIFMGAVMAIFGTGGVLMMRVMFRKTAEAPRCPPGCPFTIWWHVDAGLLGHYQASRTAGDTPLEIVQKRLGRGEITREEFDQIKIGLEVSGLEEAGTFQHASRS